MNTFTSFIEFAVVLVVVTGISRVLLSCFGVKNPVVRMFVAALMGGLLFQVTNRIYVGFWDPFWPIALPISIIFTLLIAAVIEIIASQISRK